MAKEPFTGESTKLAVKPLRREGRVSVAPVVSAIAQNAHTGPKIQQRLMAAAPSAGRDIVTRLPRTA